MGLFIVRFHGSVQAGVNQYTGAVEGDGTSDNVDLIDGMQGDPVQEEPIQDRDELPEDRFHQADIVSQHMIDTREKQRMEKVSRPLSVGGGAGSMCVFTLPFLF